MRFQPHRPRQIRRPGTQSAGGLCPWARPLIALKQSAGGFLKGTANRENPLTRNKNVRLEISLKVEVVKLIKVKSYTRVRNCKIERVKGYERRY